MKNDRNYYKNLSVEEIQRKMLEYNKKNHLPIIRKDSRTIEEEENIILNKYGGKKLNTKYFYSHLSDFFGIKESIDYFQKVSPCKIIFAKTEEIIPDEYFYSFYLIPIGEEQKRDINYGKEVIVYITSRDGINVYISGFMNEYILCSRELIKEFHSAMSYYAEGIAVYFEDMENENDAANRCR